MAEAHVQKDDKDPSVEEILQSIRRIIAEDGDEAAPAPAAPATPTPAATGSDVLELTEIVKDDGTVVNIKNRMAEPAIAVPPSKPVDVLSNIDKALEATDKKAPSIKSPAPDPVIAMPAAAKPLEVPPVVQPAILPPLKTLHSSSFVSDQAVAASAETFRSFAEAATRESTAMKEREKPMQSPAFRSGATVEDLVAETLRPLLKEWLDKNLPTLVQKVVEKEIRRIANTAIQD